MSNHTRGTAADHILYGRVTTATIDQAIANCAWCQEWRMNRECWHQDAKDLLQHGLHAAMLRKQQPRPRHQLELAYDGDRSDERRLLERKP